MISSMSKMVSNFTCDAVVVYGSRIRKITMTFCAEPSGRPKHKNAAESEVLHPFSEFNNHIKNLLEFNSMKQI